jgi:formate-dependent phosphoribosylglycinamide formyltransferase (GAR transformylase)
MYDTGMRAPKYDGPAHRFISWNVAGMRALMKKDAESLQRLVEAEQVDAICLQVRALNVGALMLIDQSCVLYTVVGVLPDC